MKILNCFSPGLLALLLVVGCGKSPDKSAGGAGSGGGGGVIKVGEFASLTGKEAAFGQSSHKGTQLAIDEINAAGGVLGKKLELVYEDDQCKQGEAATIVKKF